MSDEELNNGESKNAKEVQKEISKIQADASKNKSAKYNKMLKQRVHSLKPKAVGKKSILSGNFKVLGGTGEHPTITLNAARELYRLDSTATDEQKKQAKEAVLSAFLANGNNTQLTADMTDEEYETLVETYLLDAMQNDKALVGFTDRNPLIHLSNLVEGVHINQDTSGKQADNTIYLPKWMENAINADFDGDTVQFFGALASSGMSASAFVEMLKWNREQENRATATAQRGKTWNEAHAPQKSPAEAAAEAIRKAEVLANPVVGGNFGLATKFGQTSLGLGSYYNTLTSDLLYYDRNEVGAHTEDEKRELLFRDEIAHDIISDIVEQKGISQKKGMADALANPNSIWNNKLEKFG